jgi:hypothetical protein
MANPYLATSRRLRCDYLLGIRGWGLILYGALPASLAALGAVTWPKVQLPYSVAVLPLIFVVGMIPIFVVYLLVRQRLKAWYLMQDQLTSRSLVLTVAIFLTSTLVGEAAAIIQGKHELVPLPRYMKLATPAKLQPIGEALLLAIVFMIGSSTLFLAAAKEDSGLPALPSKDFASDVKTLRESLTAIGSDPVWGPARGAGSPQLAARIRGAIDVAGRLIASTRVGSARRGLFESVAADLERLESARGMVAQAAVRWDDFFAANLNGQLAEADQPVRDAVQRLKGIADRA